MKNKNNFKRILSLICVFCVVCCGIFSLPIKAINTEFNGNNSFLNFNEVEAWNLQKYNDYISANQGDLVDAQIDITAVDALNLDSARVENSELNIYENGQADFLVNVSTSGFYNIGVTYSAFKGAKGYEPSMEISLALNGQIPYEKAKNIELTRCYKDDKKSEDSNFSKNESGNDVPFVQKQQALKRAVVLEDSTGYTEGYLKFYFEKGENKITIFSERGDITIYSLKLFNAENNISYKEYLNKYDNKKDNSKNKTVTIRAELPEYRSNYTIVPSTDTTSVATTPNHISEERLNVIGGTKWQTQGEWLAYNLKIEQDGWYKISVRYRNNVYPGTYSTRRLYIDGEVPFKEAGNVKFNYTTSWKAQALGDGKTEFKFYLTKGTHLITLEAVTGDMAEKLARVQRIMQSLNNDYMKILTFTGSAPDDTRDYNFEELIPDVLSDMKLQMSEAQKLIKDIKAIASGMGDNITVLNKTALLLKKIVDDPDLIVNHFAEFQDNVTALGTWVQTYSNQPLELDTIYVVDSDNEIPSGKASFFENLIFRIKKFLYTFIKDYDSTNESKENRVDVWIASSSEQAKIIQQMADETFLKDTGIFPNIQLVAGNALLPSVLSKTGPDVYLGAAENTPIDYAIRSAVLPLNECKDFEKICERFSAAALLPLTFNGVTYALPEAHNFPVMLYRKDIFDQLNLSVPETWEEFYKLIPVLQNNNMMIGYSWDSAFSTFLYQRGGQLYTKDQKKTNMDSNIAMLAFKDACELFTLYDLPVAYSLPTRFRTGEMPLAIIDYLTYNTLEVSAPEIKGLWGMALVPGTVEEDGSINHSVASTVTACMMLNGANVEDAWEFMCWWTDADVQGKYAVEMESIYGPSAKLAAANVDALSLMSWDKDFYSIIDGQRKYACGTPQIPGGYYTTRALSFAFNNVYNGVSDSETALEDELADLNAEIRRKRKEFGLDY